MAGAARLPQSREKNQFAHQNHRSRIRHLCYTNSLMDRSEFLLREAKRPPEGASREQQGLTPGASLGRSVRGCQEIRGMLAVRASRRARWALLSMSKAIDSTKKISHPEEAAEQLSRRTHDADPLNRLFLDGLFPRVRRVGGRMANLHILSGQRPSR